MSNIKTLFKKTLGGLPWWASVVRNKPCNAGDAGLIPGEATKILYAMEPLRPCQN